MWMQRRGFPVTGQINLLLDLMYRQLETKKALTFRIKSLYQNVKQNYPEYVLSDVDAAIREKFSVEDGAHV